MFEKTNTLGLRKGVGRLSPYKNVEDNRGASFPELIVVMVIIVVLAAIATPIYLNFKNKGTATVAQADGKAIAGEISALTADIPNYGAELGSISISGNNLNLSYGDPAAPTVLTTPIKMSAGSVIYSTSVRNNSWCFVVENKTTGYARYTNDGLVTSQVGTPLSCNMFSADEASFENGLAGWYSTGGTVVVEEAPSGGGDGEEAAQITQTTGTYSSLVSPNYYRYFTVGTTYTFKFSVYNAAATARTVTFQLATNLGNFNSANLGSVPANSWKDFTTTFVPASAYTTARLQPVVGGVIGNISYMDKMSLSTGKDTVWTNGF